MSTDPALRRLADAILIPPFPGIAAPRWILAALGDGLAGVTLYGPNVAAGPERLAALTASLRSVCADPVVAIDEEGGDVTRLGYATGSPYPGNAALGAVDDTTLTRRIYQAIGTDLFRGGINVNMAPCLDVLATPENPVVGTRSFGSDPALVSRHGAAAIAGLQSAGVAACGKHFPGHGSTMLDSHAALALVLGDMDEVAQRDLPPFRAAIEAGVLAMMPGHLRVPDLTGELPASLSRAAIALLREQLGFTGLVISDALEMRAVSEPYGVPWAAVRAAAAGTDLLCLGREVSEDGYLATREALCEAVRSGELPSARLEEAAANVAGFRARLAVMRVAQSDEPVPSSAAVSVRAASAGSSGGSASAGTSASAGRARTGAAPTHTENGDGTGLGLIAARRALQLTGPRPILHDPLIIEVEPPVNAAAGHAHWGLASWVPADSAVRIAARPTDTAQTAEYIVKLAANRSLVLLVRDAHRSATTQDLVTAVLAERPDTVLVEMGLPLWEPQEGTYQAHLATFGASRASSQAAAELLGLTQG